MGSPVTGPLAGVVTVGTDHHRFDRLMDWLERWNTGRPGAVRWHVQYGSTRPMAGTDGFDMKPREDLLELLRSADVVVTQGGPGGIMDSRECGTVPIVVPRLARLEEVVDDHQVAFARQLAGRGLVVVAESEAELHAALDRAVGDPASLAVGANTSDVSQTVARFDAAVAQLLASKPARGSRRSSVR
ncbi:glycosyltransferase [Jatrophihabitans sp.]|jgi:UDP-N-acetylglucosamine transferase subunit ALG13|uniref:glycosyltransferase n=1 Tax=Jatrophihabitans sp. TaxID=1932789 RepID=UPI002F0D1FFE